MSPPTCKAISTTKSAVVMKFYTLKKNILILLKFQANQFTRMLLEDNVKLCPGTFHTHPRDFSQFQLLWIKMCVLIWSSSNHWLQLLKKGSLGGCFLLRLIHSSTLAASHKLLASFPPVTATLNAYSHPWGVEEGRHCFMKEQTGDVLGSGFRHGQLWQQLDLFIDLFLPTMKKAQLLRALTLQELRQNVEDSNVHQHLHCCPLEQNPADIRQHPSSTFCTAGTSF